MRTLLLALLMLNVLYALWSVLRPLPLPAGSAAQARVGDSLVLLGELDHSPVLLAEQAPELCVALGPFASEAELQAFAAVHLPDQTWRVAVDQQSILPMYRVYVPPPDAGLQGSAWLASVREDIVSANLDIDSYLVVGGDLDDAVSLGLFAEQRNARNVYDQIEGLGMAVRMQTESRAQNLYSIVMAGDEGSDFIQEIVAALQATSANASITEKLCEMIALPD
ncbi:MAG: hypothetical protein WD071_06720 [Pseudohongiella sp.]|uniref:hypothetical protein n=1 Tax=Pseudohongiella sp. TaxID=1979412 RepID=UPI0034A0194F